MQFWSSVSFKRIETACIKMLNQFVDCVAFTVFSIIFCFLKLNRYHNSTIKWKSFIVNFSIEVIYLILLVNLGLIIEAIDHLTKIVKSKLQNPYRVFLVIDHFSSLSLKEHVYIFKIKNSIHTEIRIKNFKISILPWTVNFNFFVDMMEVMLQFQ